MRIVFPKCGIVCVMIWAPICAFIVYAAVRVEDGTRDGHMPWLRWVAVAVFFGVLGAALVKPLRAFPLTYTGGTYRVRRRTLQAGDLLIIGPIENVAGRRVEFSFYLAMRDVGLSLRPPRGSARIAVVDAVDWRPLDRMTIVVHAPLWLDSESEATNWNEMAVDIPWKTRSCYAVVQSCESAKRMRIHGRIMMGLPFREFLHPPDCAHFRDCRSQVNPQPERL